MCNEDSAIVRTISTVGVTPCVSSAAGIAGNSSGGSIVQCYWSDENNSNACGGTANVTDSYSFNKDSLVPNNGKQIPLLKATKEDTRSSS